MDELQAGVEQPLAVLPQPPVLVQPGKAALDDPALGYDLEGALLRKSIERALAPDPRRIYPTAHRLGRAELGESVEDRGAHLQLRDLTI